MKRRGRKKDAARRARAPKPETPVEPAENLAREPDDAQLAAILADVNGHVSKAAGDLTGMEARRIYQRIAASEGLQIAVKMIREARLDRAEEKLDELVEAGDIAAITFTLERLGAHRGYFKRSQLDITANETPKTPLVLGAITPEARQVRGETATEGEVVDV